MIELEYNFQEAIEELVKWYGERSRNFFQIEYEKCGLKINHLMDIMFEQQCVYYKQSERYRVRIV